MKITAIKAQVKHPDRVSIYVDDVYSFSLTHNQLLDEHIHSGLEIDEDQLTKLKERSDYGKQLERVLRYVLIRPHSQHEIELYLRRKKVDEAVRLEILRYLQEHRYIDDHAFAHSWVRYRMANKQMSRRALMGELRGKGVSDQDVQDVLAEESFDETDTLKELVTKKRQQGRYQDQQKLTSYLARRGFSYSDIQEALGEDQTF